MYKEKVEEFDDRVIYRIYETIMKDSATSYKPISEIKTCDIDNGIIAVEYLCEIPKITGCKIMNNEIKITHELRPCKLKCNSEYKNALFHMFDTDGKAVVEFEDGTVTTFDGNYVIFVDNKFKDYCFE